jgi:hypothetical protein
MKRLLISLECTGSSKVAMMQPRSKRDVDRQNEKYVQRKGSEREGNA